MDENKIEAVDPEAHLDCVQSAALAVDLDKRRVTHVVSTARLDRSNRIVEPAGWNLANFKKAPRVLADHGYSIERVIGRAMNTHVASVERLGEALISTTEFDDSPLGDVAFRLASTGMVNTWSVGWIGTKSHRIGEMDGCEACEQHAKVEFGRHFERQELLEYSMVAIPANPDAVNGLCAAGLVTRDAAEEWHAAFATKAAEAEEVEEVAAPVSPAQIQRSVEFYKELSKLRRGESLRAASLRLQQKFSPGSRG